MFMYGFESESFNSNIKFDRNIIAAWSCKRFQGFGCSPSNAVHDLSLERRKTVWSLSSVSVIENLKEVNLSTRGPGIMNPWCIDCFTKSIVE